MRRPLVAVQALGVFPIPAALGADTAGVKGVPQPSAGRVALPEIGRPGHPFAFGTEYLDVAGHSLRPQWHRPCSDCDSK